MAIRPVSTEIWAQLAAIPAWEWLALGLGIVYVILAAYRNSLCWLFGGLGTAILTVLFWNAGTIFNAALHLLYTLMSAAGLIAWRKAAQPGKATAHSGKAAAHSTDAAAKHSADAATEHSTDAAAGQPPLPVRHLATHWLLLAAPLIAALGAALAHMRGGDDWLLAWLDAVVALGGLFATALLLARVVQNWPCWVILNALSVWLCLRAGLLATAILMALYCGFALFGWLQWTRNPKT